ncbi:MAG TPA: hypothetical protein VGK01_02820 [Candidatus Angelobacter sp.]|jgi:hypothetical protein
MNGFMLGARRKDKKGETSMNETIKVVKEIFAYTETIDAKIDALRMILEANQVITGKAFVEKLDHIKAGKANKWNEFSRMLAEALRRDSLQFSTIDQHLNQPNRN